MAFLRADKGRHRQPQFVHKTGVYIVCDLFEQCSRARLAHKDVLSAFVPAVFAMLARDQDAAVQQACLYVLGVDSLRPLSRETARTRASRSVSSWWCLSLSF